MPDSEEDIAKDDVSEPKLDRPNFPAQKAEAPKFDGFRNSLILLDKIDQMIMDDDEENFDQLSAKQKTRSNKSKPDVEEVDEEFKLDQLGEGDDLFLSELGNILLTNEEVSDAEENKDDLDDLQKILSSCEKDMHKLSRSRASINVKDELGVDNEVFTRQISEVITSNKKEILEYMPGQGLISPAKMGKVKE